MLVPDPTISKLVTTPLESIVTLSMPIPAP